MPEAPPQSSLTAFLISLQDLLRSPQYSPRYTSNQDSYASLESLEPSTDVDRPWHGSRAVQNAGNESVEVMGHWEGEPLDHAGGYNGIEFSPEAQALADYFNKGGVGGISALDLGFTHTPSLFPDHLFEPNVPDQEDSRFFLPSQRFCVGYAHRPSIRSPRHPLTTVMDLQISLPMERPAHQNSLPLRQTRSDLVPPLCSRRPPRDDGHVRDADAHRVRAHRHGCRVRASRRNVQQRDARRKAGLSCSVRAFRGLEARRCSN